MAATGGLFPYHHGPLMSVADPVVCESTVAMLDEPTIAHSATDLPIASPAAQQYFAAHPRRPHVYFGDYLLLQTLGEGEFGKVKLGVHRHFGEETAIKLIKREMVAAAEEHQADGSKTSKVEREISVLRLLRHPNIVHLYEVIESERYIGIVLEYGAGGELFDYILAQKCLQEREACRLFAQLVSGVSYLHRKKIIHRDLKLENLLLDRHRNVIITDFGFANNFSARSNDLMATSCGSPCYAAPELVVQDGMYVGAAVDVWSCGVILYAMLAGYLPFDDDPANPDGDNINMLYKYIMATPLSFPDYITAEPRSLLQRMLVPDPAKRATLDEVMDHPWLAPYRDLFHFSVEELESAAVEQQAQKRQAFRDQMVQPPKSAMPPSLSLPAVPAREPDVVPVSATLPALPTAPAVPIEAPKRKSEADEPKARTKPRVSDAERPWSWHAPPKGPPRPESRLAPPLSYNHGGMTMLAPVSVPRRDGPTSFGQEPPSLTSFLPPMWNDKRPRKASLPKDEAAPAVAAPPLVFPPRARPTSLPATEPPAPEPPAPAVAAPPLVFPPRTRPTSLPVSPPATEPPAPAPPAPAVSFARTSLDTSRETPVRRATWWRRLPGATPEGRARPKSMDVERPLSLEEERVQWQRREAERLELERAERQRRDAVREEQAELDQGYRQARDRLEGQNQRQRQVSIMEVASEMEKRLSAHVGTVDPAALTTRHPDDVFAEILDVLHRMGIAVRRTRGELVVECLRPKRLNALERLFASRRQEQARQKWVKGGAPAPRVSDVERGVHRLSLSGLPASHTAQSLDTFAVPSTAPEYGSAASSDGGHEVRFAVGITRIPRLQGLYSVDIRRLKGNAWSYKFVYDTLLQRLDLGSHV